MRTDREHKQPTEDSVTDAMEDCYGIVQHQKSYHPRPICTESK